MEEVSLVAEAGRHTGSPSSRRLRAAGKVPAVLYGHGLDPRHISLPAREFALAIRGGANTLLTVDFDGGSELALPKSVQRDPVRGNIEHVDLILVRRGERVTVDIPITITGEPVPDTLVNQDVVVLTVEAEATAIPDGVEVSIQGRRVGQAILARDVRLPAGVTLVTDPEALVVGFMAAPTAEQVEAELAEAEAEAGIEHEATDAELEAAAEQADGEAAVTAATGDSQSDAEQGARSDES